MRVSILPWLASLAIVASAHFQLAFPPPRGPFNEDNEPTFCDGYTTISSRAQFPLTGGFITLHSEHSQWTAGVELSTAANPTSFNDFNMIVPFFQQTGEGDFCIPLDLSATNATGLQDGTNVTLQILFDGGDGTLLQCTDLTLSSTFTIDSATKSNCTSDKAVTTSTFPHAAATSPASGTSGAASPTGNDASALSASRMSMIVGFFVGLFSLS